MTARSMRKRIVVTGASSGIGMPSPRAAGLALLGEQMATTPVALALESLGAVATAVGIVVVARRTAWLIEAEQQETTDGSRRVGWG
ncbi:hypothetical protein [Saccharopolyspora hattusasensis]|uniref:hypothetical protein n=1 Tax=Saccharopolyspora hattusasensis TaxID=1128679 RepID=UPI003D99D229